MMEESFRIHSSNLRPMDHQNKINVPNNSIIRGKRVFLPCWVGLNSIIDENFRNWALENLLMPHSIKAVSLNWDHDLRIMTITTLFGCLEDVALFQLMSHS